MRIGTFLLGGLVGAAAVIYLSDKKNRSMMLNVVTSPADSLGKMLSRTTGKAAGAVMNAMTGAASSGANGMTGTASSGANGMMGTASSGANGMTGTAGKAGTAGMTGTAGIAANAAKPANAASSKGGLAQVDKIVNEDPELKRTVNEILTDSGKSGAQLQ